ncbi:MAG: prepilin-type N-terminal cleavage/methylation domain-containing protein [Proteobacteria bacterium]|nr:prepilin-type N-terminal cleavage/methylation domain-containing protein [Pseudomonadota bacterium]NOG60215.1 prepilin-type N-terminal cleavage/methylation domain-containing protein [Pseudomonadota bacterium]
MSKYYRKTSGFSLIELVVAIVVLSIGTTAFITLVINTTKNSIDPQIREQGNAIARAYLEEIMLMQFCDPDWDPDFDVDANPLTNPQNCPVDCNAATLGAGNASACTDCAALGTGWGTEARGTYDDICDYDGLNDIGAIDQTGSAIGGLENYTVDVTINDSGAVGLNGLSGDDGEVVRIDVDVTHSTGATVKLSSYKTNY